MPRKGKVYPLAVEMAWVAIAVALGVILATIVVLWFDHYHHV